MHRIFRTTVLLCLPCLVYSGLLQAQSDLLVPDDYATVQEAIDSATAGDTVRIGPGTYSENLVIDGVNVNLRGDETARVILESGETGDAGTILTISGVDDVTIRNLTFARGETAVSVDTSSGVHINNNVLFLGDAGTALSIAGDISGEIRITNNTFVNNDIAISSEASANLPVLVNNVFSGNNTTLESGNGIDDVSYSCYATGENQITGDENSVEGNVNFANPGVLDFHLNTGSACIDLNPDIQDVIDETDSDAGAYGGELAEPNPFPPQELIATPDNNPADYSIQLDWQPNNSYLLKYYKVYYGSGQSGTYNGNDAESSTGGQLTSPVHVDSGHSITLQNLTDPATPPEAPVLTLSPGFGQIRADWSEVSGANSYIVHWGMNSTDENRVETGDATTYLISGLENGTTYRVEVSARKQSRYYLAVSAVSTSKIDNPDNEEIESALSGEVEVAMGDPMESPRSNTESGIPEEVVPYPSLPDQGDSRCFIATSAYGSANAADVMTLRHFRDTYLLPYAAGRAFVATYYRHSPALADWLDRHPGLKPAVRLALKPVVWLAISLPYASPLRLGLLLLPPGLLLVYRYNRRKDPDQNL